MEIVPPLTLLYTVFTYFYEIANIGNSRHFLEDLSNKGRNVLGTTFGAFGFGGLVKGPIAFTNYGKVKGTTHRSRNGMQYFFFKGIPYARPPINQLRFEPPEPHPGWNNILDARSFRSECPQISVVTGVVNGNEDCLYLNIATRKEFIQNCLILVLQNQNELSAYPRPVIFWIHGGYFFFGGSNIYLPRYWMDEDVVVVTINYRLGSLGFLNSGDGVVAGNMGLKDQVAALRFVHENIHYFNGDPERITIIGEGAGDQMLSKCNQHTRITYNPHTSTLGSFYGGKGYLTITDSPGASVHYLTMSPISKGLFSRAISLSGTTLAPWAFTQNPGEQAREFAEGLRCPIHDSVRMILCLKSIPARKLLQRQAAYFGQQAQGSRQYFVPTVDSGPILSTSFLYAHPMHLLKSGHVDKTVPWITGVLSGEGCTQLIPIMRTKSVRNAINSNWHLYVPVLLGFQNHWNQHEIADQVKNYYLGGKGITEATAIQAVNMFSDRNFYLDNHEAAILHSHYAPVYLYYWNYISRFSMGNLLLSASKLPLSNDLRYMIGTAVDWLKSQFLNVHRPSPFGASHSDDLPILFSMPGLRPEIVKNDVDYGFSRKVIRLFVSFAENGIPDSGGNVLWYSVRQSNSRLDDKIPLQRLKLNNNFEMMFEPFFERMQFWKNVSVF